jgi:hypothetical protein
MFDITDEITLELARLQRAAFENARKRAGSQQLGEAWTDIVASEAGFEPAICGFGDRRFGPD